MMELNGYQVGQITITVTVLTKLSNGSVSGSFSQESVQLTRLILSFYSVYFDYF